jgi:hypothetical protein
MIRWMCFVFFKTIIISLLVISISVVTSKLLTKMFFGVIRSPRYRITRLTQTIVEIIFVFTISLLIGNKIFQFI